MMMPIFLKRTLLGLGAGLTMLFSAAPAAAQENIPPERPFQLPFLQPPGPNTWLMAQPYGNTTGAYRQRFTTYGASGGIHFGVDLSAPCGTAIAAIADGVVFAVDGPFGSPPHNLMVDHPQFGYASMYGHLLEAPPLKPGQTVKQGEVIAKVGDSGETCYSRPHLHLEIRDLAHIRKYNPALLIDANWDNLTLFGGSGRDFARDLDAPRQWQSLYDQPEVQTGGPIVNDFANPWPPDWEKALSPAQLSVEPVKFTRPAAVSLAPPTAAARQLTGGACCTNFVWSADSAQIRFIDMPAASAPVGIWGVNVTQPQPQAEFVSDWLGLTSPDGRLIAYPDPAGDVTIIERLADGQTWRVDTQGRRPSFTPDSRQLLWTVFDEDAPGDTRPKTVWQANADGSQARVILSAARTDVVAWLGPDKLLLARRVAGSSDETLLFFSPGTGRQTELLTIPRPRGLTLSPNRHYLVYYNTFEGNPAQNGLWLLNLQAAAPAPQKLPFFGAYRWRNNQSLVYVPLDPAAAEHNFYEYNLATDDSRRLFPNGTGLTIANNDWHVSPDGRKIAILAANGDDLNGIWLLPVD